MPLSAVALAECQLPRPGRCGTGQCPAHHGRDSDPGPGTPARGACRPGLARGPGRSSFKTTDSFVLLMLINLIAACLHSFFVKLRSLSVLRRGYLPTPIASKARLCQVAGGPCGRLERRPGPWPFPSGHGHRDWHGGVGLADASPTRTRTLSFIMSTEARGEMITPKSPQPAACPKGWGTPA